MLSTRGRAGMIVLSTVNIAKLRGQAASTTHYYLVILFMHSFRWILADYNVKEFTMTEKIRKILKRDQQFRAIPLPYNTVKKEIEVYYNN